MNEGVLKLGTKFTNVLGIFVTLFSCVQNFSALNSSDPSLVTICKTWEEEGFAVVFFLSFTPLPLVIFLNGKIDGSFIKSILCVPLLNLI